MLVDKDILERLMAPRLEDRIVITPLINMKEQLGPTSIDLHLGTEFKVMDRSSDTHYDPLWNGAEAAAFRRHIHSITRISPHPFVIHPKQFVLATTLEYIELPRSIQGRLDGRSIWARHGIQVHCTASLIHPGSKGIVTFELQNMEDIAVKLYPGMRLGQISFLELGEEPLRGYGEQHRAKFMGHVNPEKGLEVSDYELTQLQALVAKRRAASA